MSDPQNTRPPDGDAVPTAPLDREQLEPLIEGAGAVPKWFFAVTAVMFGWGLWYLGTAVPGVTLAGDLRSVQQPVGPPSGEAIYSARCAACHQANGQGLENVFPPLVASDWLVRDPETPIRILLLGIQGEIEVKGKVYNNVMPAFGTTLTDEEIAAVLTYVRNEWGNEAPEIEGSQVAEMRADLGDRTASWNGGAELAEVRGPIAGDDGAGDGEAAGQDGAGSQDAEPADAAADAPTPADAAAGPAGPGAVGEDAPAADVAGEEAGDQAAPAATP